MINVRSIIYYTYIKRLLKYYDISYKYHNKHLMLIYNGKSVEIPFKGSLYEFKCKVINRIYALKQDIF